MATWDDVRAAALALPGVHEVDYRGESWLNVGTKSLALTSGGRAIFKLDKGHQELLFEARPEVFSPMMAGALRWSWVELDGLDADEVPALVLEAWTQIVPKKISRAYAATNP